jgi:uncharacterized protein (TIGR03118 family)
MSRAPLFGAEVLEPRRFLSSSYLVTNLVSDGATPAQFIDKNLVNPWGISVGPFGIRVSDNGSASSTAYNGNGKSNGPTAQIPGGGGAADGAPTGIARNDTSGFVIHKGNKSGPATYIYVNEDGGIVGFNSSVSKNGILAEDSSDEGNVYKGDAIATSNGKTLLYAADFHGKRVEVYDNKFHDADLKGDFKDPALPSSYGPFNIAAHDNHLFIAFAQTQKGSLDEAHGAGLGFVDEFNTDGTFVKRIASHGTLNAPWGIAFASRNFGPQVKAGDMLVGNFGDGRINIFSSTGSFKGQLDGSNGKPISIGGLWGIAFGNGQAGARADRLYFTAGTNDEADGLLGSIKVVSNSATPAVALGQMPTIFGSSGSNKDSNGDLLPSGM